MSFIFSVLTRVRSTGKMNSPIQPLGKFQRALSILFCGLTLSGLSLSLAQEPDLSATRTRFEAADSPGVIAHRNQRTVFLDVSQCTAHKLALPRLAAPLRAIHWQGEEVTSAFKFTPEQLKWILSWDGPAPASKIIELEFDTAPLLLSETKPVRPSGDGSFFLAAHLAKTEGEKVRYEPQTFKNTVGYWTGKMDSATWTLQVDLPGTFNVGILQGCGAGQGGSQAVLNLVDPHSGPQPIASLELQVIETGHFQNFEWHHVGKIEILSTGQFELNIAPGSIKKAALMDVRAIHLIRLPAAKK